MQKLGFSLLILVLGAVIGWLIKPDTVITNTKQVKITDTLEIVQKVKPEPITVEKLVVKHTRDTLYLNNVDSSYVADLLTEYYCSRQKVIDSGFERIQAYEEITTLGDTLNIEFASVADMLMKVDIKFAARDVVSKQIRTVYLPQENKEDAWYVKPAIALSGLAVGYVIRGNQ
jgi:hypothetical protein